MGRDVPFDEAGICDDCGKVGAFDFMGDLLCPECSSMYIKSENTESGLNRYAVEVHAANKKWWMDLQTGAPIQRNFGEMIALCHSELSEALEGHRKDLMDTHLPDRKMVEVELADCLIRIFDIAGALGMDIEGAYQEKMAYNAVRADHKTENRIKPGGKKY